MRAGLRRLGDWAVALAPLKAVVMVERLLLPALRRFQQRLRKRA